MDALPIPPPPEGRLPLSPREILEDYQLELAGLVGMASLAVTAAQTSTKPVAELLSGFLADIEDSQGRIMHRYSERCGDDASRIADMQGVDIVLGLDQIGDWVNSTYGRGSITPGKLRDYNQLAQEIL